MSPDKRSTMNSENYKLDLLFSGTYLSPASNTYFSFLHFLHTQNMFKFASFVLSIIVSLQMVHAFSAGQVQVGGNGYRKVEEGAVAHCGTNTDQQCLQIETPLTGVSIKNDANLDIACTPSGICGFAFDFNRQSANVTVNCVGANQTPVGRNVFATFGKSEVYSKGTQYAHFYVYGQDVSAMWENEKGWTAWAAVCIARKYMIDLWAYSLPLPSFTDKRPPLLLKEGRNVAHQMFCQLIMCNVHNENNSLETENVHNDIQFLKTDIIKRVCRYDRSHRKTSGPSIKGNTLPQ